MYLIFKIEKVRNWCEVQRAKSHKSHKSQDELFHLGAQACGGPPIAGKGGPGEPKIEFLRRELSAAQWLFFSWEKCATQKWPLFNFNRKTCWRNFMFYNFEPYLFKIITKNLADVKNRWLNSFVTGPSGRQ